MCAAVYRRDGQLPELFFLSVPVLVSFVLRPPFFFSFDVLVPFWGFVEVLTDKSSDIFVFCGGGAVCFWVR